mmetsp:Transcript_31074/g.109360  ORF Transcript_31074/g.109360 Transcript_31074/m.109360 type:complete len:202 (+) Transcript_31074:1376-1981(+)
MRLGAPQLCARLVSGRLIDGSSLLVVPVDPRVGGGLRRLQSRLVVRRHGLRRLEGRRVHGRLAVAALPAERRCGDALDGGIQRRLGGGFHSVDGCGASVRSGAVLGARRASVRPLARGAASLVEQRALGLGRLGRCGRRGARQPVVWLRRLEGAALGARRALVRPLARLTERRTLRHQEALGRALGHLPRDAVADARLVGL